MIIMLYVFQNLPFSKMTDGLSEIGIPGKEYLRDGLKNCADPIKTIEGFQTENGVLLPSLNTMLPLLDLHGMQRFDFHTSVMDELKVRIIPKKKDKKLRELLQKSFPVIRTKALRPVVMAVLKHMEHVEEKYLKEILANRELYDACDTEVKRQIWQDNQALFGDEVSPLLSSYIEERDEILLSSDPGPVFFNMSPKQRRQLKVVQNLTHMIGKNVKLYDMVLQFLRTLFLKAQNDHYCTLRVELLMALHDLEILEITAIDPCHKFTWCLDACIREKSIDAKRSRELQGFLDNIRGQEQLLGDLTMTLCDPYAINFLATYIMKILHHNVTNETLPRDNALLILLLRLLVLGLSSRKMIECQNFKEPKLDSDLVTKFLPAMMSLIVDDQARALASRLPPDDREAALTIIEHSGPPPDAFASFVQNNNIASVLGLYYALSVAKLKDKTALMRILGPLALCEGNRAFEAPFLHTLVGHMVTGITDEFSGEDFCTIVFDEFFLTGISKQEVALHLLRLLTHIWKKMPSSRVMLLMKSLQPSPQHSKVFHKMHQELQEAIKNQPEPAKPVRAKVSDSPINAVPTPSHPSR
ncbi:Negative elongation factor B [Nymphon striatum]|nr:Negative elongation factor B [Nymphon striatum]